LISDGYSEATRLAVKPAVEKDNRLRYYEISHIGRVGIITNFGLAQSVGKYIAILDDDDLWICREKLEKQVAFLEGNEEYVVCGSGCTTIDENGNETGRFLKPEKDEDIRRNMLMANPIVNSSSLFRRTAALSIGGYDETFSECADWEFWMRIGRLGKLYNIKESQIAYRIWRGSLSFAKQRSAARSALRIISRHKNAYPGYIRALSLGLIYAVYAQLPRGITNLANQPLSRFKKAAFAKSHRQVV